MKLWQTAREILTAKQLEAFELHHLHDISTADIAAHLGVTRQAIEQRLQRAAQKIAAHQRKAA